RTAEVELEWRSRRPTGRGGQASREEAAAFLAEEAAQRWTRQRGPRHSQERRRAPVGEGDATLVVEEEDRIVDVLGDQAVARLGLAKRSGQLLPLQGLADRGEELVKGEGLDEVGKGRPVDRLEGGGQRGVPGHQDDFGVRGSPLDDPEQL